MVKIGAKHLEPSMMTKLLFPIPPPRQVLFAEQSVVDAVLDSARATNNLALVAIKIAQE